MTTKKTNYYLLAGEDSPYRTWKIENFIEKSMFLPAIARSRFNGHKNQTLSKIGIFNLVTE
jgi:hypothetical protein